LVTACGARPSQPVTPNAGVPVVTTEDQFARVQLEKTVEEPLDEDGRRGMDVRGEFGRGVQFATRSQGFSLLLRARAQLQGFVTDQGEEEAAGFQMRRLRMLFRGHGLHRLVSYYIQLGFSDRGLEADRPVPLRDAFFAFHPHAAFHLSVGQMKVPFDRQRMMSSSKLQLVERSNVVEQLNIDRDIGVQAYGDVVNSNLKYHLGVFGGDGRNRANSDLGLLYAARLKWVPLGAFEDGVETDLSRERRLRVALAGAIAFNHKSHRIRGSQGSFIPDGEVDYLHVSAEAVAKYAGFSLAAQYLSREARELDAAAEMFFMTTAEAASVRGAFGQAGYLVTPMVELAGRLGWLRPFGISSGLGDSIEATGGLSWYILKHDFKLQSSYTAVIPELQDTEHLVRVQTQFFF
ncbi:MAG: OprO/OprP family phosphate-selective porin, partial [Deltaproteobacteria bacterium]|nr:OprO/OprP family phosphate-selective porin [Deltaproteobacteria bacterium]